MKGSENGLGLLSAAAQTLDGEINRTGIGEKGGTAGRVDVPQEEEIAPRRRGGGGVAFAEAEAEARRER